MICSNVLLIICSKVSSKFSIISLKTNVEKFNFYSFSHHVQHILIILFSCSTFFFWSILFQFFTQVPQSVDKLLTGTSHDAQLRRREQKLAMACQNAMNMPVKSSLESFVKIWSQLRPTQRNGFLFFQIFFPKMIFTKQTFVLQMTSKMVCLRAG